MFVNCRHNPFLGIHGNSRTIARNGIRSVIGSSRGNRFRSCRFERLCQDYTSIERNHTTHSERTPLLGLTPANDGIDTLVTQSVSNLPAAVEKPWEHYFYISCLCLSALL